MKTARQNIEDEITRYGVQIESLKQDMFWAAKEHEMKMRRLADMIEEYEGYIKSDTEYLELTIRTEEWSKKHQQKTIPLE
jgi:hypothetical protein